MRLPESPAIGPHAPAGIADDKRGKPEVVLPRAAVEDNLPRRRQPRVCECRSGGGPSGTGTVEGHRSCARSRPRVCFPVRGGGLATPTPIATAVTTTTAMVTATMTTTAHGGAAYVAFRRGARGCTAPPGSCLAVPRPGVLAAPRVVAPARPMPNDPISNDWHSYRLKRYARESAN